MISRSAVLRKSLLYPCIVRTLACVNHSSSQLWLRQATGQALHQNSTMAPQPALTLALLGDVMLGRLVDDSFTCDASRKKAAFGDVGQYLASLDPAHTIIAGNLECAVTSYSKPTPKAFNFKLSPENADALQVLHLDFVATANNHVLDYGLPGLQDTNAVLDRLGIQHAGSGTQPAAAQPAVVTTTGGHQVAFLSYSDHYEEWAATETTPGINFIDPTDFDASLLQRQVSAARAAGPDLVVVLIHWGPNWHWQPDKHLRELGHAFLAAGADLVFGTSPHHIQGVEVVGGKPIIYSGGSFVDDYAGDRHYRNDLSAVFLAHFVAPEAPAAAAARAGAGAEAVAEEAAAGAEEQSDMQQGRDQVRIAALRQHPAWCAAEPAALQLAAAAATASRDDAGQPCRGAPRLVLQSLHALPIAITHSWRTEGGPYQEAGLGNPAYFSQVDFATGQDWDFVASKLQQLSQALGNTGVQVVPAKHSIRLFEGTA